MLDEHLSYLEFAAVFCEMQWISESMVLGIHIRAVFE